MRCVAEAYSRAVEHGSSVLRQTSPNRLPEDSLLGHASFRVKATGEVLTLACRRRYLSPRQQVWMSPAVFPWWHNPAIASGET